MKSSHVKASVNKCLRPDCVRVAEVRGLCTYCYQSAARAVRRGKTTWEKLQAAGKITESSRGRNERWFLE